MNNKRRQRVNIAISELENVSNILSDVYDEENDALGNMPENLESSDRYLMMEECVDYLEDAISMVSDATDALREVVS